jgi:L-lactate dehydrogenase complex protein LldG
MSGAGRPRLASLLPPVHVALVRRAQIVASLGAWLDEQPTRPAEAANCVVITGPSRTADIEMTLTRGVHGPRSIHVVFVT